MSLPETLLLGCLAGGTIMLGVPVGRIQRPAASLRTVLNAVAIGILLFLVWDVLSAAWEPIDAALARIHEGRGGSGALAGYGALFAAGLSLGLLSLVAYEQWMHRRSQRPAEPVPPFGPGAMDIRELRSRRTVDPRRTLWSPARRLALLIAVGIGLHNFAEGLAIGQSAASGQIGLAALLVVGFGLHNATEGFGIVAPLAGQADEDGVSERPTWSFLLALAAIGGAPTFVGTVVGHAYTSEPVAVVFLTLAAGSIIYVITQLLAVAARSRRSDLLA